MKQVAKRQVRVLFPHNAVVVNLAHMPQEDALDILQDIRGEIVRLRTFLSDTLEERENLPLGRLTILQQQLSVTNALYDWSLYFRHQYAKENHIEDMAP